jgi:transcriptional regulator with XRE-family HTH domain
MDAKVTGERVRALREQRGWSRRMLSELAGLSDSYVSKLEAGEFQSATVAQLQKIARALSVGIEELIPQEGKQDESRERDERARELEEIQVNLRVIQELDEEAIASIRKIVLEIKENAERKYLEERRAERRRHRAAGPPRPPDRQI